MKIKVNYNKPQRVFNNSNFNIITVESIVNSGQVIFFLNLFSR